MVAIEAEAPGKGQGGAAAPGGFAAGLSANIWWGFLPLLFYYLDGIDAVRVVAARTACCLVVVGIIVAASGRLREVAAILRDRRTALTLVLSAALLASNWLIYVYAVQTGQVLEGSFGYFINPMVNVGMGMLFLGERQSRAQIGALLLALVAIGIQALGIGQIPYISLGLALSFGLYGYFRKTVRAGSATGLMIETMLLTPLALAYLVYSVIVAGAGPLADPRLIALLLSTGPATAAPLLLFAYAARRLRLTTVGMLQYVAPSIQFGLAITFFGEQLNLMRLASFLLVWLSLAIFSFDSVRRRGRPVQLP